MPIDLTQLGHLLMNLGAAQAALCLIMLCIRTILRIYSDDNPLRGATPYIGGAIVGIALRLGGHALRGASQPDKTPPVTVEPPPPSDTSALPNLAIGAAIGGALLLAVVFYILFLTAGTAREKRAAAKAERAAEARERRDAQMAQATRRAKAIAAIDKVRDQYGARLTDIVYVIEHWALFDATEPATVDFTNAYAAVMDADLDLLDLRELEHHAATLRQTWTAATANADAIGINAHPASGRRAAARAAKLARKANSAGSTPAESAALMAKVAELLSDTLGLTLPASTQQALTAAGRAALTATSDESNFLTI